MWLRASAVTVIATLAILVPHGAAADPGLESQVLQHANQFRAASGLAPLQFDGSLSGTARSWSSHLADSGSLSHSSFTTTGAGSHRAENVGMGTSVSAVHAALVGSPTHAANLLDPGLSRVGIGVVVDDAGTVFVTQQFVGGDDTSTATTATTAPSEPPTSTAPSTSPNSPVTTNSVDTDTRTPSEVSTEPSNQLILKLRLLRQLDG